MDHDLIQIAHHQTWLDKYSASGQAQHPLKNMLLDLNSSGTTWLTAVCNENGKVA